MKKNLFIILFLFTLSNTLKINDKPFLALNDLKKNKELTEIVQNELNNQQVTQQQKIQPQNEIQKQNPQMKLSEHDQQLISKLENLIKPVKQSLQELIKLQEDENFDIFQPEFFNEIDIQSEQQQIQQNQENNNNEQQNLKNDFINSKQIQQISIPVVDELNYIVDNLPEDQNFPKQSLKEIKDFIPQNFVGNKIIDEIQDTMKEQTIEKKDIQNLVKEINQEVQQQKQNYENSIDNIGEQVEINDAYIKTYEELLNQIKKQQQQRQQLLNILENEENIIEQQLLQTPQNNYQLQLKFDNLEENLQQEEQQLINDDAKIYIDYLKKISQQPENQIPSQIIQEVLNEAESEHLEQPILNQMQELLSNNQNNQIPTENIEETLNKIQDHVKKNKRNFNKNKKEIQFDFQKENEKQSYKNVFDINNSLNNIIKRVLNVQKELNDIKYEFQIPDYLNKKINSKMFNQLNQNAKNNQIPKSKEFINEDDYYQFE